MEAMLAAAAIPEQRDDEINSTQMAERTGLSRRACLERLRSLEKQGKATSRRVRTGTNHACMAFTILEK